MSVSLQLDNRQFIQRLRELKISTIRNCIRVNELTAVDMENHSKQNRPWTDRTGNARASIYGLPDVEGQNLVIYHGILVDYGVFLETANGGNYRVIKPTIDKYKNIWIRRFKGVISL